MNLKNYPRKHYAINQFCQPHNHELKGRKFYFSMDGGTDYELEVTGEKTVLWNKAGEEAKEATYECVKGDDTTYLLDFDVADTFMTDHATNLVFIIDLEQRLVTVVTCWIGWNKKFPYLVKSDYDFGAIVVEGLETPFRRHCLTTQMVGTRVEWHWNYLMWTHHNYYSTNYYTLTWPDESIAVEELGGPFELLPCHDEIAQYVKIKENLFAFCLTEEMMERMSEGRILFRSNNMIFLQNYNKMMHAGRTFGHATTPDGKTFACRTLFGSFGNPVHIPDSIVDGDNKYTV
ncbi:MAG: MoaF N-terminal domain-containing protein [Oscillospiraceae bacterium]|nr:MoaF N-terminal domain-containing protein [Oscillospiraceae bacterium]